MMAHLSLWLIAFHSNKWLYIDLSIRNPLVPRPSSRVTLKMQALFEFIVPVFDVFIFAVVSITNGGAEAKTVNTSMSTHSSVFDRSSCVSFGDDF